MTRRLSRIIIVIIALLGIPSLTLGQAQKSGETKEREIAAGVDEVAELKKSLLANFFALEATADKLRSPLARAVARIEIADAVWELDQDWAEKLLREAYELVLPDQEERLKYRNLSRGSNPIEPNKLAVAQNAVRQRLLSIARRDADFAKQLIERGQKEMGVAGETDSYSTLAVAAIKAGELPKAREYLLELFDTDPSQVSAGGGIRELASQNREEADRLVFEYIRRLRTFPLTRSNAPRIFSSLSSAVFPVPPFDSQGRRIPVAGPDVIRAYLGFMIESLTALEQRDSGAAKEFRSRILSLWPQVRQLAPELVEPFLLLESISRVSGKPDSLPDRTQEEKISAEYETRVKTISQDSPKETVIETFKLALGRQDYTEARRQLGFVSDKQLREKHTEILNQSEAVHLTAKGNLIEALQAAYQLKTADSILRVFPQLIKRFIEKKDRDNAVSLVSEAVKTLSAIDDKSKQSLLLSTLAGSVAPVDEVLALEILYRAVQASNKGAGRAEDDYKIGIDTAAFTRIAPDREAEIIQIAYALDDPLQKIAALTAIYRWKAGVLKKTLPQASSKNSEN